MDGQNASPFCCKLELYLKLAKIPYEVVKGNHYNSSPKNKLPYIQINDELLDDSSMIVQNLSAKFADLDAGLDPQQKAQTHLIKALIEERLYFFLVWFRWIYNWSSWKPKIFARLPFPLSLFVPKHVHDQTLRQVHAQGTARHSPEQIFAFAKQDFEALSTLLGDKPFFIDGKPRYADVIVYSTLSNLLIDGIDGPMKENLKLYKNLLAFVERMKKL